MEELSLLCYLFMYLYRLGLTHSYFIQQFVICFYYYLFWYSKCPRLASRSPFKPAPRSSWHVPIILWTLPFCHKMMFQPHLTFSQPQSWNRLFLQGALVPFHGEEYLETKIWVLNVLIATKCAIASRPSQQIDSDRQTHRHTPHVYFYI